MYLPFYILASLGSFFFCSRVVVDEPVNDAVPELNVNGRKQWHPFLNVDHLRHQLGFASSVATNAITEAEMCHQ